MIVQPLVQASDRTTLRQRRDGDSEREELSLALVRLGGNRICLLESAVTDVASNQIRCIESGCIIPRGVVTLARAFSHPADNHLYIVLFILLPCLRAAYMYPS